MIKVNFILYSISSGSINRTLIYKSSFFLKKNNCLDEIPNNLPNDLFGTNLHKTLESC